MKCFKNHVLKLVDLCILTLKPPLILVTRSLISHIYSPPRMPQPAKPTTTDIMSAPLTGDTCAPARGLRTCTLTFDFLLFMTIMTKMTSLFKLILSFDYYLYVERIFFVFFDIHANPSERV